MSEGMPTAGLRYACTKIEDAAGIEYCTVLYAGFTFTGQKPGLTRPKVGCFLWQSKMKPLGVTTFSRRERNFNFVLLAKPTRCLTKVSFSSL